ncbi:restriction endonuclease subunit S [Dyadobacter sp. MSC1_007]|uniref:restriction endonuclease subunit S n=1 Tax=Dyadobacter sp. MSC1_007 TaxID=2909264 RepID=UPI00202EB2D3|nr:restriction endonuclease subunit S [Dyadobacter sp. MSC1_007]
MKKVISDKNIPAIRFQGFEEGWKEKKLEKVGDFSKGRGYSKKHLLKSGCPIILYGRLYTKYQTIIEDVDTFVIPQKDSVYSRGNEVIVPSSGETAEDISRASAVLKAGIVLGGDLNVVSPFENISPVFLALSISNGTSKRELSKRAQGKSVVHLHNSDLRSVKFFHPCLAEQTHIGNYFNKLDGLILLQEQKLEKITNLKKAMLEKMFPKENTDVPEIRFSGFTEKWQNKKLGEVSESLEYGLNAAAIKYDGINKYLRITDIEENSRRFILETLTSPDTDLSNADSYKLRQGDILFARTGASVGKTYHYSEKDGLVYFAGFLIRARIKPNTDSEFVFQNTLKVEYSKFIKITSQRSGQPGVNAKEYSEFAIKMPVLLEQQKIGQYFQSLDKIISQSQQKIQQLKNLKQAMLQKMFI